MTKLSDDDCKAALGWFFRTPQGQIFHEALQSVVEEIGPTETCALHRHDERRRFAANLIAMAEAEFSDGQGNEVERRHGRQGGQRKSRRHGPSGR